ncbi:hypothetical protein SB717_35485, partial [Priestia sp. SIMBA_032]|uniref:hypothetical protein n=1 Tax=Priestia sp. SIMBA_032 TaxID=3085775 RepID=UPI00397DD649
MIAAIDVLYLDGYHLDAGLPAARMASRLGKRIVSDLEVVDEQARELLPLVTELVAPAAVIRELAGGGDTSEAVAKVAEHGP